MKGYWASGGECLASRPGRFTPSERVPGTHWIGGPGTGLDAVVKQKIPRPCRDSNPRSSSPLSSTVPLSYPGSWEIENLNFTTQGKGKFVPVLN
jgi:hypothetical protein